MLFGEPSDSQANLNKLEVFYRLLCLPHYLYAPSFVRDTPPCRKIQHHARDEYEGPRSKSH
jgi:hypothetical protein